MTGGAACGIIGELNPESTSAESPQPTSGPQKGDTWILALLGPAILLAICSGFYWKITLTDQYTWLDSPDLANLVLPWYVFQAGEWHEGRVPLWDPHIYGGQTIIGQAEPGLAYPLNWALFSLPLRRGWLRQDFLHWYFVVIHFMAAVFCFWLCRDLKRSRAASILAGAAFGLGGYLATTDWPYMMNGAVWTPLVFLFLLRVFRGERPAASAALSGAFLGMAWLSGHHQIPIFISLAAAGVWLAHIFRSGKIDWRLVRLGFLFTLVLTLVSGLQALPAYEYGKLAVRWINLERPVGWKDPVPYRVHDTYSLIPSALPGIVIPGREKNADPFIGVVAFSLALLAVALGWERKPVRVFALVATAGLLFSLGRNNVFHGIFYAVVPLVEKARNPSMAIAVFHFGVAVLAAFGVDSILSRKESPWLRRSAIGMAVFGSLLLAVLLVLALGQKAPGDDRFAVVALVALLFAPLLLAWQRGNIGPIAAASMATVLMLVELGNVSGIFWRNKVEKDRESFLAKMKENWDIAAFLQAQPWPVRIEVSEQEIPFNFGQLYGIDVFGGFQASLPVNLMRMDISNPRVRRMFGINYSVQRDPPAGNTKEVFQGAGGVKVYWNLDAFPRVWTVHEAVRIYSEPEIGAIMRNEGFDLSRKTFLFEEPPAMERCQEPDFTRLVKRTNSHLAIEAEMKCQGMAVISDSWFPGWSATVDGKPARIHEAYASIRGVVVPKGRHRIEMRYRPLSVYLGGLMTACGLLTAAGLAWRARRRCV